MTQDLISELQTQCLSLFKKGKVAAYIPALQSANPKALGICISDMDGNTFFSGEYNHQFTIQSIAKVVSFICCLLDSPYEKITEKISFEPTTTPFNSIADLETQNTNKPLNPMINAGAIATIDFVSGNTAEEKFKRILSFMRLLSGNEKLLCNEEAFHSEQQTGDRNRSLAYYMKSTGIIESEVDILLEVYFRICSIDVTCVDLANIALVLANNGMSINGERYFPENIANITRTVIAMCGMYNESGQYAIDIGVPSKSGVGGGILAVVPNRMGIGIYGPSLNEYGNSVCGIALMKELNRHLSLSIF